MFCAGFARGTSPGGCLGHNKKAPERGIGRRWCADVGR